MHGVRLYFSTFMLLVLTTMFCQTKRYIETALSSSGIYFDASTFRVLRLFRILQLEHFVSAFSLLDDVWTQSKDTLAATGLLALVVWVGSACLFYLFEKVGRRPQVCMCVCGRVFVFSV